MARRTAVIDDERTVDYATLVAEATAWSREIGSTPGLRPGDRVCYLIPPGTRNVSVMWGIWGAGCVAVPVALSHPGPEVAYLLDDADPSLAIISADAPHGSEVAELARERGVPVRSAEAPPEADPLPTATPLPTPEPDQPALMIYTSGTTGRPKGVVTTHGNVTAQIEALVSAWGWSPSDRILHVLPLHHVHGLINVLSCALWTGAACEFCPSDPREIWERLAGGQVTLFMAVPTVYRRLIQAWEEADAEVRARWSEGASRLRLMVSGSAALPVATLGQWRRITGHTLLERYGMTEIGMGLSNPLEGERRPGHVGQPLPGVEVRIVDPEGRPLPEGESGEIEVRGPQVFSEYWRRPDETRAAFRDGWFRTGDEGVLVDGYYRILGRRSVDILKTGGYKVSALEVEDAFREHPAIHDVAVVGVPDPDWGERICAAWVPSGRRGPGGRSIAGVGEGAPRTLQGPP